MNNWNEIEWLTKFKIASKKKKGFRQLRADVFKSTLSIVEEGKYQVGDKEVTLEEYQPNESVFYESIEPIKGNESPYETKFITINADCLEAAKFALLAGMNPVALNMASRRNPGGGVHGGAGAQEENIFRRSNLYKSMFQFVEYASDFNVIQHPTHCYPLNKYTGGIYSPKVTVFRSSEFNGYGLLRQPYQIAFVSVPAISKPELTTVNGQYQIAEELVETTKEKIRTILRIALTHHHDSVILSAFGCGAFRNPPNHMAELFKAVFEEVEFKNKFKLAVFSIIDDHNAWHQHNPHGNTLPFFKVFE